MLTRLARGCPAILEAVEDPLYFAVGCVEFAVVQHEGLVNKDRSEDLGCVVVEPSMPDAVVKIEEILEPLVERFNSLASTPTQLFSERTAEEQLA